MAGNASNWHKATAGPLKGQAVYVPGSNKRGTRTQILGAINAGFVASQPPAAAAKSRLAPVAAGPTAAETKAAATKAARAAKAATTKAAQDAAKAAAAAPLTPGKPLVALAKRSVADTQERLRAAADLLLPNGWKLNGQRESEIPGPNKTRYSVARTGPDAVEVTQRNLNGFAVGLPRTLSNQAFVKEFQASAKLRQQQQQRDRASATGIQRLARGDTPTAKQLAAIQSQTRSGKAFEIETVRDWRNGTFSVEGVDRRYGVGFQYLAQRGQLTINNAYDRGDGRSLPLNGSLVSKIYPE